MAQIKTNRDLLDRTLTAILGKAGNERKQTKIPPLKKVQPN